MSSYDRTIAGDQPGPGMMYQVQRQAYAAAAAYAPTKTDSTPTAPPSFAPADLVAACARKREVVTNLPTSCAHCEVSWEGLSPKTLFNEMNDGTVIAYCRAKDGCSRSRVLFVEPDRKVPHYEQVCVFDPEADHPSLSDMLYTLHGVMPSDVPCTKCRKTYKEHPTGYDTNGWRIASYDTLALPRDWPTYNPESGTWNVA